jgi:hypothetical protein
MHRGLAFLLTALGLLSASVGVAAHHAFAAEFDANKPVKVTGVITKMEWVNPHSWLYVDVKGRDGKVINWAFELGPVNTLYRRGWTKHSVQPGTEVVVEGYAAKNAPAKANGRTVTFPDGRELFAGSSGTGAPSDGRDPTEKKK